MCGAIGLCHRLRACQEREEGGRAAPDGGGIP